MNKTPSPQIREAARRSRCAAAWLVVCVLAGCGQSGPPRFPIKGRVSIDGQPLKAGVIRFIPTGTATGPAAVATIKDGAFALKPSDGAVAGTQRVEIEALPEFGFEIDDELAAAQYVQQGGAVSINAIPEIYNQRSTLTREIKPDETNEFDFQLSTTGDAQASR